MNLNRYTPTLMNIDTMEVFDHFVWDQSDLYAVDTITDSGTVLMGNDPGGIATLTPSDSTVADNDEVYLATPNEVFKFGTNREIYGKWRVKWTETSAGVYNAGVGFMNAVGADTLIDNGGGPKLSGSALAVFKVDGGTVWKCATATNGVGQTSTSTAGAVGATWYIIEIECKDWDGVNMMATYKVDGQFLKDSNGIVIKHQVPIASAVTMALWAGAKLGAATNNDPMLIDYWYGCSTQAP